MTLPAAQASAPPLSETEGWRPGSVPAPFRGLVGVDLHAHDHWFRCETTLTPGAWVEFGGLATIAEIWIDDALVATSRNMFLPLTIAVPPTGGSRLDLCFRALRPVLRSTWPGRRARWRGRLAEDENLRHVRTTLLGHMPGWSGDAPVIGPTRPIVLHQPVTDAPVITRADLRAVLLPDGTGRITLVLDGPDLAGRRGTAAAGGRTVPLVGDARLQATLDIPDAPLWWPHTHGEPVTLPVTAEIDGVPIDMGQVGFRTIERREPRSGFGLVVNGVSVFCRGAIWTGLDASACPADPTALATTLHQLRRAGLNMLRVSGMTTYEDAEFFRLCDELGIMVWHDFMFARFDYPDRADFLDTVRQEAAAFLDRVQAHPSLAVLCGGTECSQAAAMSGRAPADWQAALFDDLLAEQAASYRPDVPYVPQSPLAASDGALPFAASAAVSHYFGVGAFQRPLEELRAADVRFAAECLAFANLPEPSTLRSQHGPAMAPREAGAAWNFGDVRDHYVLAQFGGAASAARRQDESAWQEFGRCTVAWLMQGALATWRTDARCAGALVLMSQDLLPSAGWGIVAEDGRPKSAWYGLRSVCQPVQVILRDLTHDGIVVHTINEMPTPRRVLLNLRGLTLDGEVERLGETQLELPPHAQRAVAAATLMGRWRDLANAWQFGPPNFAVLGATLDDAETGTRLSDATFFPVGLTLPRRDLMLVVQRHEGSIEITARNFAQFVQIDDDTSIPAENYFHLWPGERRIVELIPRPDRPQHALGTVHALNGFSSTTYGMAA
ncbi:MAG: glycoside hydrolase family 2 protein [Janthinobacterium lividum]